MITELLVTLYVHTCNCLQVSSSFDIVHRTMRATERMISDVTNDIMRDVTTSVITMESRQLAADFHTTYVMQRLEVLQRCCHAVEMLRVRACLDVWQARLSSNVTNHKLSLHALVIRWLVTSDTLSQVVVTIY